jgi:hypothetical protein
MQRSEGWRSALLGVPERFDKLWHPHIAHHGYDNPTGAAFYPLYHQPRAAMLAVELVLSCGTGRS